MMKMSGKKTRLIDADALKLSHCKECALYPDKCMGKDCDLGAIIHINEMPTVDLEPQWIPCSERLPENMEPVNITWVNREPESYYMHIKDKPFTATGIYFKGKWYWWSSTCDDILCEYGQNEIDEVADGIEIVAWMPLPKPYEVEDEKTD